jgi:glutamine synthetase
MNPDPMALLARDSLRHVLLCFVDPAGQLRGKLYAKRKVLAALEKGGAGFSIAAPSMALDYGDMQHTIAGISDSKASFGDFEAVLDPESFWPLPWADESQNVIGFLDLAPRHADYCARGLCRTILDNGAKTGQAPVFGLEWEFTLLDESAETVRAKNYANLTPATSVSAYNLLQVHAAQQPLYDTLTGMADAMGLGVEAWHCEMGPGFMEVALAPAQGIRGVDQAVLLKFLIKQAAARHGLLATFMARWNDDADGQGGHVHMSLCENDRNLFSDNETGQTRLGAFIAGLQRHVPEFLLMFAPNVNSYRRYQPGIFAPVDTTWNWDSRAAAFRAVGAGGSLRVENRVPGADCNPYHAVAATAAAGLNGIAGNLEASPPGTPGKGPGIAGDLLTAAERFRCSQAAKTAFGATFTEFLAALKRSQAEMLSRPVTDVEKRVLLDLA